MNNKLSSKILRELSYQTGHYTIAPEFLSLVITMRCNFRCQACSIWEKKSAELSDVDWLNLVPELTGALKDNTFVEINGGEPLMRKDLTARLIESLKKYFKKVALNSNGLLISEDVVEELNRAGLDTIKISLYSLDKDTHNNLRGHALAFDQAKKAIEIITKNGLNLEVGVLITKKNILEVPKLIEYLRTLSRTSIILQPLDEKIESVESKNRASNQLPENLWPEKKSVDEFFSWVLGHRQGIKNSTVNIEAMWKYYLDPKSALRFRCFAGQRNLVISPSGDVTLCFKGEVIGNLKKQNLKEILKNATNERKKIKHCQKYCRIIGCNFSRGLKEFAREKMKA